MQMGARFFAPVQTGRWGPPSLLHNGVLGLFPGCRAAWSWRWPPTAT